MNSVAPIASLADILGKHLHLDRERYNSRPDMPVDAELLEDTEEEIGIIKKRSEGHLRFTQVYRNLNKLQNLKLTTIYVQELFRSIDVMMPPA